MIYAILALFASLTNAEQAYVKSAACSAPPTPVVSYLAGSTGLSITYADGSQQLTIGKDNKIFDQYGILRYEDKGVK